MILSPSDLISLAEARTMLATWGCELSKITLYGHARRGTLGTVKVAGRYLTTSEWLGEFLAKPRKNGRPFKADATAEAVRRRGRRATVDGPR